MKTIEQVFGYAKQKLFPQSCTVKILLVIVFGLGLAILWRPDIFGWTTSIFIIFSQLLIVLWRD